MTPDLVYLALTAMLCASLWLPYVVSQFRTNGPLTAHNYVDPVLPRASLFGERAHRAYLNAAEVFAPYAALVLAIQISGKAGPASALCAGAFFWLRLGHAMVYWLAIPYVRTALFLTAYLAVAGLFVILLWR